MILDMLRGGCRVGFFGLGKSNSALLSHLPLNGCHITIRSDKNLGDESLPKGIKIDRILCGDAALDNIDENVIFFSPSVRRERDELQGAKARGVIFSSDAELFFELNKTPVIAITGSDGKSTTATLTHLILNAAGYKSELIGNIGEPMMSKLNCGADYLVCEMSSFMLRYLNPATEAACITNITPNHLDWHSSFEEYRDTKLSLISSTRKSVLIDDFAKADVLVSRDKAYGELMRSGRAVMYITKENEHICKNGQEILPIIDSSITGHNLTNLMLAIGLTDGLADSVAIGNAINDFTPLPHRCECFLRWNGIDFYDSSVDSTPSRTAATLNSLGRRVVIILGGKSKGLDYSALITLLKIYAEAVILTGENADEIYSAIGEQVGAEIVRDFEAAVKRGAKYAKSIGALLLSPASTSYDRFKSFAERGAFFKEICNKIAKMTI